MLYWAFVFLVFGLIAGMLGFTSIAGASISIAKFLTGLFLVLFLMFLILGMSAAQENHRAVITLDNHAALADTMATIARS